MRMVDEDIKPGQRWVSDAEPELGLGVVMGADGGRVSILFPAADDLREYALDSAPVRRVAFEEGDNIKTHDGQSGSIEAVKEEGGFLHYQVKGEWVPEAILADTISFGVAPAIITYLWIRDPILASNQAHLLEWYWIPFLFFSACNAFRLARFNVMHLGEPENKPTKSYFLGVPAPAAAVASWFSKATTVPSHQRMPQPRLPHQPRQHPSAPPCPHPLRYPQQLQLQLQLQHQGRFPLPRVRP